MSEDNFILEKRHRTVQLDGRKFVMREMSAEALHDYTQTLLKAGQDLKAQLKADSGVDLTQAMTEAAETELLILMDLLKEPADGGQPADEAFLRGLSSSQRQGIFTLQDELNDLQNLLKKTAALLA